MPPSSFSSEIVCFWLILTFGALKKLNTTFNSFSSLLIPGKPPRLVKYFDILRADTTIKIPVSKNYLLLIVILTQKQRLLWLLQKKCTISFLKLEHFLGNVILFKISVFGGNIKGTTLTRYFIKTTAYPRFCAINIE